VLNDGGIGYTLRITFAVIASLLLARFAGLPEAYWAPITTLMALQPTFPATRYFGVRLVAGTALGAGISAALADLSWPKPVIFVAGILLLGLITAALGRIPFILRDHTEWAVYRFAGFALAIVILVPWHDPLRMIALHRFMEVVIGSVVAVAVAAVWPVKDAPAIGLTQVALPGTKTGVADPIEPPRHQSRC
jgi:uncharacterized membrane protein YccC